MKPLRLLPWMIALASGGLFGLQALAVNEFGRPCFGWDLTVARAVQELLGPGSAKVLIVLSLPGSGLYWAGSFVVLACLGVLSRRGRREALVLLTAVLASNTLKIIFKTWIARPRPARDFIAVLGSDAEIYGFPSGHTAHYTVLFGLLLLFALRSQRGRAARLAMALPCVAMLMVVGVARVGLGLHWPSDIVGGHLLGLTVVMLAVPFLSVVSRASEVQAVA